MIDRFDMSPVRVDASIGEPAGVSIKRGWYVVTVDGLAPDIADFRLRMDIGRGFSEHHSIGVWHTGDKGRAIARVFKDVQAIQPTCANHCSNNIPLSIQFSRMPASTLFLRRIAELFSLMLQATAKWLAGNQPRGKIFRRYLRWRDMFSFPPGSHVHSEYDEWIVRNELLTNRRRDEGSLGMPIILVLHGDLDPPGDLASTCITVFHWSDADEEGICAAEFNHLLNQNPDAWIISIEQDHQIHQRAIEFLYEKIKKYGEYCLFYGDHDCIDCSGRRFSPHFQFGFSLDRLRHEDYLGPVIATTARAIREIGGWPAAGWNSSRHKVLQTIAESGGEKCVVHVPKMLAHATPVAWQRPVTTSDDAAKPVLQSWPTPDRPLVSIIIPTKDRVDLLSRAVASIFDRSEWTSFEIIVINHESKEQATLDWFASMTRHENLRILPYQGVFNFSDMNNRAAREANGQILAFLNNDVEVLSPDWIDHLAFAAVQPDIGCAGAMLLYPDGTVQHDGISLGIGGVGAHAQCGFSPKATDANLSLTSKRNVAAVTGACLFIKTQLFNDLNGFDAQNLPVAFNDIDLCLRAMKRGLRNIWLPQAQLIHHESATRKTDKMKPSDLRFMRELLYIRNTWGDILDNDPYYSVNFDLRRPGLATRL